ncbi:hypothetical protein ACFV07_28975 [Streptomyces anulatus]|uniref:hypothetical protein n=1 Tax=Streptomyces anulatus TaxID=1892 RepID=UPI00369519C6
MCMSDGQVTIKLTSDEALVLSHWLEKLQMTDLSRVVDDPEVWAPIHRIVGQPEWPDLLTPTDRRGLTPQFWSPVRPLR